MRKNLIRRIACLASVVLILCACAVPAFALGDSYTGDRVFGSVPIDYYFFENGYGPMDWPFFCSRYTSNCNFRYQTLNDDTGTWDTMSTGYVDCVKGSEQYISGSFTGPLFTKSATSNGYKQACAVSMVIEDEVVYPMKLAGDEYKLWYGRGYFSAIRIYGSVYVAYEKADGQPAVKTVNFSKEFGSWHGDQWSMADYLLSALLEVEGIDVTKPVALSRVFIDFEVVSDYYNDTGFTMQMRDSEVSTTRDTVGVWINNALSGFIIEPSDPADLNVGTFLGNSVSSFMTTPIWGEFTLGHFIGISLTLGLLFYVLRMLV